MSISYCMYTYTLTGIHMYTYTRNYTHPHHIHTTCKYINMNTHAYKADTDIVLSKSFIYICMNNRI